ncbi:hydantoinase/oxoprolinase family protein [Pistricoccus aurantiacus]|uniref:Hydantoinase/oxoprolinase family protein n=1 Tax=Pistricoccus aurantiacus TaxID=1883414 RepID=A0A5B8SZY6_9GAMM|nr:hydantoinase/oxoprolinase family protein [Pistricoccus aurantiacus]QEA40300.1 hydantoinase/oxoprolinase family protein [Pistricoccus aurantiacus]
MIIGIDVGGTHIDGAVISNGNIVKTSKKITDRNNLFETIWTTLKILLEDIDKSKVSRINLSTTVSTNAIVEKRVSKVGMIVQSGPGMNYDFSRVGDQLEFISGYTDHRGVVVKEIVEDEIKTIRDNFIKNNMESIGIVSKFSTRNPSHEKQISEMLIDDFDTVAMGHSSSGRLNFPRRVNTTYLSAAVNNTFREFAENFEKSLKLEGVDVPIYVLKADGGTMDLDTAKNNPIETILSGPAASFMGLSALFSEIDDGVLLDIGGTTTDIFFLADGVQLFEPLGINIDNHKTLIRAIYSVSIGLGGDSYVRMEDNKLKIGPQRMGPPIAFGGEYLTPTDAMVALGKLDGGNKEKAVLAVGELAKRLDLSIKEAANKILDIMTGLIKEKVDNLLIKINAHPVYTVKELLENKRIEPQFVNVIGGPAKILAPLLEKKFAVKVKYPEEYKTANAVGAALAKPTIEINMLADTERGILSAPEAGIYETINRNYNLEMAENRALEIVRDSAIKLGANKADIEAEIVESNSFNMVKGFSGVFKNIRVRAQTTPGLIHDWRSQ